MRKVVSGAREGLDWDKFKSKYGTQANVGFRPSMVYTSENEGEFSSGDEVDLFFLFDASASQDNQITEMLKSAQDIVKHFAGTKDNKDKCHVGSALFLGNSIKFMCSSQCKVETQTLWDEASNAVYGDWRSDRSFNGNKIKKYFAWDCEALEENQPFTYNKISQYTRTNRSNDYYNGVPVGKPVYMEAGISSLEITGVEKDREDWIQGTDPRNFLGGTGADGNKSGFRIKMSNYASNEWMPEI